LDRLGIEHGVIMSDDPRRKPHLPVHVASIDTIHRREDTPPADLLILDEAHFAVSDTWKKLIALGYLVPSVVFRPKGAPDLSGVAKTAGEFNKKQLAEVCDKPKLVGDV